MTPWHFWNWSAVTRDVWIVTERLLQLKAHCDFRFANSFRPDFPSRASSFTSHFHSDARKYHTAMARVAARGRRGGTPPNPQSLIEWTFYGKTRLLGDVYRACGFSVLWASNMPKMRCRSGLYAPDSAGEAHDDHQDPLVGREGGQPLPNPHPSRHLGRSASVVPNVKSWLRPWLWLHLFCALQMCEIQTFRCEYSFSW